MATIIETSRVDLANALRIGAAIVAPNSNVPVLNNTRIAVEKGQAQLHFTDLDCWLWRSIPATADAICVTTVPAAIFMRASGAIEGDIAHLEVNGRSATLSSGRSRFRLPTEAADGFPLPKLPEQPENGWAIVKASDLAASIVAVSCAAPEDGIQYPKAIHFEMGNGDLELAAFDGKRLAFDIADARFGGELEPFNLPLKSAKALSSICREAPDADVEFYRNERMVFFTVDDWSLYSRLCDDKFPPYHSLINNRCAHPAVVDPAALAKALERLSLVSDGRGDGIRFDLAQDRLTLTLVGKLSAAAREELEISYVGEAKVVGYRLSYLRDAFRTITSDTAEIHFEDFTDAQGLPVTRAVIDPYGGGPIHMFASYILKETENVEV